MFAFAPTSLYGDSIWAFFEDQTLAYNYLKNGLSLGGGYTGIREQFRNEFNSVLNDSVTLNTVREQTDTTGMDVVLRRRTDGTLQRIRADLLGVGGGGDGIDDVLAVGQALTTGRTIDHAGNLITHTSTGTLFNIVNTNASATPWQRYGIYTRDGITGAANSGIYHEYNIDNASSSSVTAAEVGARWTDATAGSEDAQFDVLLATAGAAPTSKLSVRSSGRVLVNALADTLATLADVRAGDHLVGTFAQRTAITGADGYDFFQTDGGRDAPPGRYYFVNSKWNYVNLAPERLQFDFNEFSAIGAANTILGQYVYTATGSAVPAAYGVLMSTLASTTGRVVFYAGSNGLFGGWVDMDLGSAYMKVKINLTQLSTAGEEFALRVGFTDMTAGTEPNNGVYIEYDRLSSVNWRYTQAAGAGTRTETASSTPVATGALILEVYCPGAGGTSEFWVNGTSIGTQAATMPTVLLSPMIQFVKSAGSTPVTCSVDYSKTWHYLTTSRD